MQKITEQLFAMRDLAYRDFMLRTLPTLDADCMIGVRTPLLRRYAKGLPPQVAEEFIKELPHRYYEENNLHGMVLGIRCLGLSEYLDELERFLPFVDNWATCDMLSPKVFRTDLNRVYGKVQEWIGSERPYTVRFALVTLLQFFLDEAFEPEQLALAAGVQSEHYYVRMAVAWYFSIALVKQYAAALPYFTTPVLDPWTHNKALQKATESLRMDSQTKSYLRSLKVTGKQTFNREENGGAERGIF